MRNSINKVNFGIIGYGRIAHRFIDNLKLCDGNLYAIASKSKSEDLIRSEVEVERVYSDYHEMLRDEHVEIVYIAQPHKFHYPLLIDCIQAKKAVICEKPLVLNMQEMQSVIDLARKENVLVMEALKTRMIPTYHRLKELISTIELESIECGFCYKIEKNNSYLFDPVQGGALLDVGSYSIGFVLDIVDCPVIKVESNKKMKYDVDVHFNAKITFANGVIANVEGAMDEKKDSVAILKGKKGIIRVPYFYRPSHIEVEYYDSDETKVIEADGSYDMRYEIMEIIDLYRQDKKESSVMSLDDSLQIASVIETIKES